MAAPGVWNLVIGEAALALRADADNRREAQRAELAAAWHVAALSRARRIPRLKKLLGIKDPAPSAEELDEIRGALEEVKAADG